MSISFRPGLREKVPLLLALAGPSKSGKTMSAQRLTAGMVGAKDTFFINTEGARGHMYLDKFPNQVYDLDEPYTMERYREAILAAKDAGAKALIIDSLSHAHEGSGGMLDQHEKELDRMLGNDKGNYARREKLTWAAWVKPKADEARMIGTMIQVSFPIVICLRAKEKLKIEKGQEPKDLGWQPICSDRVSFETVATLLLPPGCNGIPDLKAMATGMREPVLPLIKPGEQLSEAVGKRLLEWANGAEAPRPTQAPKAEPRPEPKSEAPTAPKGETITDEQQAQLLDELEASSVTLDEFKKVSKIEKLGDMSADRFEGARAWIAGRKK